MVEATSAPLIPLVSGTRLYFLNLLFNTELRMNPMAVNKMLMTINIITIGRFWCEYLVVKTLMNR